MAELVLPNAFSVERQRGIWLTVALLLVFIAVLLAGLWWRVSQGRVLPADQLDDYGAVMFEVPRTIRPLDLVDENAQSVDQRFLQGKWSLLFYGFTHCPDICPATLAELARVQQQLSAQGLGERWQAVLVAVDTERDTPEKLKPYVQYFDPSFRALSGSDEAMLRLAADTNAAFGKVYLEGGAYTVDHSSQLVLINPKGDYSGFIKGPAQAARVAPVLSSLIVDFERRYGR